MDPRIKSLFGREFVFVVSLPSRGAKASEFDKHKRCVKALHCREFHVMVSGNNIARTVSRKSGLVKSKSVKMRGRSIPAKTVVAEGAIRKMAK